ncbi:hypothetical protein P691DRAFT_789719 [Macrolepiota fuliginosa MF-IS2]|uniref:Uncharacterized protein n=1 Tax=Macrolepiota fuliginosa MF-IS2 TaxID=1400762 RepID=A0A9P5X0E0_9AGAR|nr:hypothetical protein P691DRAFT_789719 [Macrolepiota fuliginosa MF-IS2]
MENTDGVIGKDIRSGICIEVQIGKAKPNLDRRQQAQEKKDDKCGDGGYWKRKVLNNLQINLWNLNISNWSFNIVDIKPVNIGELTEVITATKFHPFHCNLSMYPSLEIQFPFMITYKESSDLYKNNCIFDKFECMWGGDDNIAQLLLIALVTFIPVLLAILSLFSPILQSFLTTEELSDPYKVGQGWDIAVGFDDDFTWETIPSSVMQADNNQTIKKESFKKEMEDEKPFKLKGLRIAIP